MTVIQALCLSAGVLILQSASAQSGTRARPQGRGIPAAPDQTSVDRGQKVFVQSCAFCHGKDANGGDSGPDLIRSALVNHDEGGNLIGYVVLNGRPDKGMPSFKMSPEQISDVANFLHARVRSIRYRQLYQVKALTGDRSAGEAFFASHCRSCHSPDGDLAHIASKYEPETLLRRILYPASKNSDRSARDSRTQVAVTVTFASGESFSGPLVGMDEFTVSMYDASGVYHTWSREGLKVDVQDPLAAHVELLKHYTDTQMHDVMAYVETFQ